MARKHAIFSRVETGAAFWGVPFGRDNHRVSYAHVINWRGYAVCERGRYVNPALADRDTDAPRCAECLELWTAYQTDRLGRGQGKPGLYSPRTTW